VEPQSRFENPQVAAIGEALQPYAWRSLSPQMVARRIVGALDVENRQPSEPFEPAPANDERVDVIEWALSRCGWRAFTIEGIARHSLAALRTWRQERAWLDIELAWLLDGGR
jgi:hypothetical protein